MSSVFVANNERKVSFRIDWKKSPRKVAINSSVVASGSFAITKITTRDEEKKQSLDAPCPAAANPHNRADVVEWLNLDLTMCHYGF